MPKRRRALRSKRPKERRTSSSFCSTISASDNPAPSADRPRCRRWTNWRPRACATTTFIRRRSVRPLEPRLLTGRNHHVNNAGAIMELATAFPGNTGIRPQSVAPLAEMLRLNGYSTAAFGKYHETPPWEVSVSGPFDRWPTHSGFDKFYGFIGGETNQWAPAIFDGTIRVEPPHDPELPLHRRHDQPGDRLDAGATLVDARQAFLRLLCHRCAACSASCAQGIH